MSEAFSIIKLLACAACKRSEEHSAEDDDGRILGRLDGANDVMSGIRNDATSMRSMQV